MSGYLYSSLQDTIYNQRQSDTIPAPSPVQIVPGPDSTPSVSLSGTISRKVVPIDKTIREPLQNVTVTEKPKIREKWNTSSNFLKENGLQGIVSGTIENNSKAVSYSSGQQPTDRVPAERPDHTYDWLLGIFLFLVVLFVWIRIFYNKFFSTLASALVSFQLSVKLFQERNVLLQRVSIVLDFIYILVTTIFVFELVEYFGLSGRGMSGINLFLLLLNILMLYAILRVIVLRLTGSLFLVTPLFAEYIHNTYVVNKALGIILFPIVIMAQYLPYKLIPVILVLGITLMAVGFLLKSFRAYQIIIRRDIIIFYLILYLCTLEILPLLLGYKFVTSLIQSN